MKNLTRAVALFVVVAPMSYAQTAPQICHHAGLTYSAGSMITMGKSLQKCTAGESGAAWQISTTDDREVESANCIYDGKQFGQGSVLDAVAAVLKCSNGTWYPS